ncbi:MAG: hypothetical protein IPL49_15325 [Saprospirales bacterium]|nr:hypothetical protein [Saprospirales bacterium]
MFIIDELKNYPVNWTDGMRIGSKDFIAADQAWDDAIRDVRISLLQGVQYGLLPPLRDSRDKSNYPKFHFDPSRGLLTLLECRAITEGGYRIEITEALHRNHQIPGKLPDIKLDMKEDIDVYITYNLDGCQEAGPISADAPPRRLFKSPVCELSAFPQKDKIGLSGVNHMKIAEFKWSNNTFEQDGNYIPPCFTVSSHPELLDRHQRIGGILNSLLELGLKLVQDYRTDTRNEVRDGAMWLEILLNQLCSTLWTYNDLLPERSPVNTIVFLKNWVQFVWITASIRKNNSFFKNNLESLQPLFKQIAADKFDFSDLKHAFDNLEEAVVNVYRWVQMLEESFRKSFTPKVEGLNH